MPSNTEIDVHQILRDRGVSPSIPRVAIYTWLMEHPVHPTVEELYKGLRPQMHKLSLMTVYNTLKVFVACGLVKKVYSEDLELRYDANVSSHAHFKCTACGAVVDLGVLPSELPTQVALPEGFQLNNTALTLWGKCAACATLAES